MSNYIFTKFRISYKTIHINIIKEMLNARFIFS